MAKKKSKDAASKADREPTAKTEDKAEPETKDKPRVKTASPAVAKTRGPPAGTSKQPPPVGPAAAASGKSPGELDSAAGDRDTENAAAAMGSGLTSASSGESWLVSRAAAWILAIILGLVTVIGFPLLIGSHGDEVADLRAQLETERQAIDQYPNAAAALEAIRAEHADIEAQREGARAEIEAIHAQQRESEARLAALDERLGAQGGALKEVERNIESTRAELAGLLAEREEIQGALAETLADRDARQARVGELETQISVLDEERGRLDGLVRATSDDLQAAMDLLEAARDRMSQ